MAQQVNRLDVLDQEVQLLRDVADYMEANGARLGQAFYHIGISDAPTLTTGGPTDPFHDDTRIGLFMAELREQWLRQSRS